MPNKDRKMDARWVKNISHSGEGAQEEYRDEVERRLYLIIQPSGVKAWAIRYRASTEPDLPKKLFKYTLGRYPKISLAQARERARNRLANGGHPALERKKRIKSAREKAAETDTLFENVLEDFLAKHVRVKTRPRSAEEIERSLRRNVLPHWKGHRIDEITKRDVIRLIDDIAAFGTRDKVRKPSPVMANRTLAHINKLFSWCQSRDLIGESPAAGVPRPAKEEPRERTLNKDEVRWLWLACERLGYPFGPYVQLLILTAARLREVAHMKDAEVRENVWRLPGARSKNKNAHEVILSPEALEVIEKAPKLKSGEGWLFTTNGRTPISGFHKAKQRLDVFMLEEARAEMGETFEIEDWRFHDLRRTFGYHAAKALRVLPVVIDECLAHKTRPGVTGVYQHYEYQDEKKAAWTLWGKFVRETVSGPTTADNVIPLSR